MGLIGDDANSTSTESPTYYCPTTTIVELLPQNIEVMDKILCQTNGVRAILDIKRTFYSVMKTLDVVLEQVQQLGRHYLCIEVRIVRLKFKFVLKFI